MTLPEGFSINPNAADGKTTCSDDEASFGTEAAAHCPEFAEDRDHERRQLGAAGPDPGLSLPRRTAAGQPLPADPHRRRIRHPHQARRLDLSRPADRPADDQLPQPAAEPAHRVQPPRLRLRARLPGDADPVRDLRGPQHLHARGTPPSRNRAQPSSSPSTTAPTAPPARALRGPSRRASTPPRPATPPAPTARSRSNSTARTATSS